MTPQERHHLTHFLKQLGAAGLPEKNVEADAMIRDAFADQPNAAYLLVQRNMLLEQALNNAKAQIAALQRQLEESREMARNNQPISNPWGHTQFPAPVANPVPGAGDYQMPRAIPATNRAGDGPGFLGNIASTAAGVVAGSFLFQGIENLLGHHSPGVPSAMHPTNEFPTEQTIINNYYGSDADQSWTPQDSGNSFLSGYDGNFMQGEGDDSNWV